jgi:hypothetical protein
VSTCNCSPSPLPAIHLCVAHPTQQGSHKRAASAQVLHSIFPVAVYASLVAAALTRWAIHQWGMLRCIQLAAAARVATRLLLIIGTSRLAMQLAEVRMSPSAAPCRIRLTSCGRLPWLCVHNTSSARGYLENLLESCRPRTAL